MGLWIEIDLTLYEMYDIISQPLRWGCGLKFGVVCIKRSTTKVSLCDGAVD